LQSGLKKLLLTLILNQGIKVFLTELAPESFCFKGDDDDMKCTGYSRKIGRAKGENISPDNPDTP
jgi:hypothetical protein